MSSGDSVLPGYTFDGRGPAQRRLVEWLQARVPDCELESAVAQRSPAGPWAIKIHAPNRVPTCAELLQAEPWIDRVAVRPQHLYVRIGVERLCEWVVEGFAGGSGAAAVAAVADPLAGGEEVASVAAGPAASPLAGTEGLGRSVLVRAVDVDAVSAAGVPRPLRLFRETAVARSIAALLRSRGFDVALELLPPGGETYDQVWAAAPGSVTHTVVVGSGVPLPSEVERGDHIVHLPVGEVDVRHGPLRARNGGSVSADDVVAEVARSAAVPRDALEADANPDDAAADAFGEAVLALLLLATPRARRIQLDDAALRRETETLACLVDLQGAGSAGTAAEPVESTDRGTDESLRLPESLRDAAAELDMIATNVARGATALDPALVARSLRSIAERCEPAVLDDAGSYALPLRSAVCAGVGATLALAGLEVASADRAYGTAAR